MLAVYYTFQVCKHKDKQGVMRVLGTLANSNESRALENPFLHNLVAFFMPMADDFAAEDFCTVVLDELFLTTIRHGNVAHHLMRLIHHVADKLPRDRLEILSKTISSLQLTNETTKELRTQVEAKIQERLAVNEEVAPPPIEDEYPLAVPTPSHV